MTTDDLGLAQVVTMTAYVDVHVPPPEDLPVAVFVFGTKQIRPVEIAAGRHLRGAAPLVIVTGGVNRHDGRVEGPWMRDELIARGVAASAIRVEETSANTEENVRNALAHIGEAIDGGLRLAAVSKWYHRRAIHALATHAPGIEAFYGIGYEPGYGGTPITRGTWPDHSDGRPRVVREFGECRRRVADGEWREVAVEGGAWRALRASPASPTG
ncbi:YdcF family protein [Phytomonospora endophytica]|uniref:DUF218 domain-containing protein n=1 Tax=Phytomonospora endophytica TaxID=714109 RepID=A0A841FMD6_9ACTN|nr:YdcF family protein [Phytomonospora endophytica]MBB6036073.1 hypothetical protein [Phytomonospora endophytica]GIG66978.1 hypothetical protein Pen01_32730 [Phytomonospora endophytica]